jgi:hypothetical protein
MADSDAPKKQSGRKSATHPNLLVGGPGRPKGVPNKVTTKLKDMILNALDKAGGEEYLCEQARESPSAFLALIGKVLPTTLQGTGEDGEIAVKLITRRVVDASEG